MLDTFFYGLLASSSLVIGGLIGIWFPIGKRTLGVVMAFGAGVLISAVSYELILDAVRLGYADASAFTRAFKRWSDTTPSLWRKRCQQTYSKQKRAATASDLS